eukprot:jgi/Mesvir1/27020/Mv20726-RA.1
MALCMTMASMAVASRPCTLNGASAARQVTPVNRVGCFANSGFFNRSAKLHSGQGKCSFGITSAPRRGLVVEARKSGATSKGLQKEGPGQGGQWLSCTTRHVHIYVGEIIDGELDQTVMDKLTVDIDPDNEFNWTEEPLNHVFRKFDELVAQYKGAPLTDYTLRLIGSEVEHFIRGLLQAGEISYNLNHRAINYSMGRPKVAGLKKVMGESS